MISVIVPVLDEAKVLRTALTELLAQDGDYEVIVADGGSTDGSCDIVATLRGVRLVQVGRGRGRQLNAGARAAVGDVLLFLHIDTRLASGSLLALQEAAAAGLQAGAFTHRFSVRDWRLALISAGHNLKCRLNGIYYGDHGIFVRRELFEHLGGFPEVRILEDVIFCERLRHHARGRLLPQVATTDARRFLQHGIWRTSARGLLILARHQLGLDPGGRGYTDTVR